MSNYKGPKLSGGQYQDTDGDGDSPLAGEQYSKPYFSKGGPAYTEPEAEGPFSDETSASGARKAAAKRMRGTRSMPNAFPVGGEPKE